jgi:hypothetical protein
MILISTIRDKKEAIQLEKELKVECAEQKGTKVLSPTKNSPPYPKTPEIVRLFLGLETRICCVVTFKKKKCKLQGNVNFFI